MPTLRPYNAEKGPLKRPDLAEEISVFHRTLLRHSRGGNEHRTAITDATPLRSYPGISVARKKRP